MLKKRLGISLLCALWGASPASAALSLQVQGGSVLATDVTPGASVAWLGLSRSDANFETTFTPHRALTVDADNDGAVTFTPDTDLAWKSVVVAVDLTTLAFAAIAPEGFEFPLGTLQPSFNASDVPGQLDQLLVNRHQVDVLLVRQAVGAFGLGGRDGGETDADGLANDTVAFQAAALAGLTQSSTPLVNFETGDLIVIIDRELMEVSVSTLAGATP